MQRFLSANVSLNLGLTAWTRRARHPVPGKAVPVEEMPLLFQARQHRVNLFLGVASGRDQPIQ